MSTDDKKETTDVSVGNQELIATILAVLNAKEAKEAQERENVWYNKLWKWITSVFPKIGTFIRTNWIPLLIGFILGIAVCGFSPTNIISGITDWFTTETEETKVESVFEVEAKKYPENLLNVWAWSIEDSLQDYTTDTKLREDIRRKMSNYLTYQERQTLKPFDDLVAAEMTKLSKEGTLTLPYYENFVKIIKTKDWKPENVQKTPIKTGDSYVLPIGDLGEIPETENTVTINTIPEKKEPVTTTTVCEDGNCYQKTETPKRVTTTTRRGRVLYWR